MENSAVGWAFHSSGRDRLGPGFALVEPRVVGATEGALGAHPAAGVTRSPPACPWLGSPWQFLAAGLPIQIDPSEKTADYFPLQRKRVKRPVAGLDRSCRGEGTFQWQSGF
jgi:hypothetical protein